MSSARNWPESEKLKFIGLYRNCECLWNMKTPNYRNREKREMAYFYIKNNMGIDSLDCVKRTIKSIRDTYFIEKKKHIKSKNEALSPREIYVPKLSWFSAMDSFLNRTSLEDNGEQDFMYHGLEVSIKEEQTDADDTCDSHNYDDSTSDSLANICELADSSTSGGGGIGAVAAAGKRLREPEIKEFMDEDHYKRINNRSPEFENIFTPKHDEFYYLGMHIAEQLRNLPLQRALKCQLKMQTILIDDRLEHDRTRTKTD